MRYLVLAALAATLGTSAMAGDISETFGKSSNTKGANAPRVGGPPAGYNDQHWVSSNGCSYSRAQAPGYAPTWHLMLNAAHVGLTDAHSGCVIMYTQVNH
jgi:hypothetical protein